MEERFKSFDGQNAVLRGRWLTIFEDLYSDQDPDSPQPTNILFQTLEQAEEAFENWDYSRPVDEVLGIDGQPGCCLRSGD